MYTYKKQTNTHTERKDRSACRTHEKESSGKRRRVTIEFTQHRKDTLTPAHTHTHKTLTVCVSLVEEGADVKRKTHEKREGNLKQEKDGANQMSGLDVFLAVEIVNTVL